MHRCLVVLLFIVVLSPPGAAQENYLGLGVTLGTDFEPRSHVPFLGIQFGSQVREGLEFRVQLESVLILSIVGVDLTYSSAVAPRWRSYVGGGVDLLVVALPPVRVMPGLHGVVGAEYRRGDFGFFLEVQPGVLLLGEIGPLYGELRSGVNLYL